MMSSKAHLRISHSTAGTTTLPIPLGRDDTEDLLAELKNAQSKLLRLPYERATKLKIAMPAQQNCNQVVAAEDRNPVTSPTTPPLHPSESKDKDGDRVGAKVVSSNSFGCGTVY